MIVPRDYQLDAADSAERLLALRTSCLVVMPTGTGKTTVIGDVTRRRLATGDTLIIAHTEELIDQLAERVRLMCPDIDVGIEMGERSCVGDASWLYGKSRVIVGSRQSMAKRLTGYARDRFQTVIIDEAHHGRASQYTAIINHFAGAAVLGVTATPDRGDGRTLAPVFSQVAYCMNIDEARAGGWLTPVLQQFCEVEGLDFSSAKTKHGDYDDAKLDRILAAEPRVAHEIASAAVEHCKDQTLVFCPGVEMSHLVAEIINRHTPNAAEVIVGDTNKDRRREINAAYKRGDLRFLVGCGVFLEGYDAPNTRYCFNARPMRVRAMYAQMAGRVMRPLTGIIDGLQLAQERVNAIATSAKPHGIIIDLTTASAEHELVFSGDILGGTDFNPRVREAAMRRAKAADGPVDFAKILHEEDEAHRKQEAERNRRRWVKAQAKSQLHEVTPGVPGGHPTGGNRLPTEGMRQFLARRGYDVDGLSFTEAGKLIGKIKAADKNGTATPKQQTALARNGLPTDVTKLVASVLLDLVYGRVRNGARGLPYTPSRDMWKVIEMKGGGYRVAVNDPDVGSIILATNLPPFRTVGEARAHFADVFNTMPSLA